MTTPFAHGPATIRLGDIEVPRLGLGTMRLPGNGKDAWGDPPDRERAKNVLKRAVELGVRFLDTAQGYGPLVSNQLIAEALHPYPADLVIATKLGAKRTPDKAWAVFNRPEELRATCEDDLRTLKRDRIDIAHYRWVGAPGGAPFEEAIDGMIALQKEGKIRHIALSNVSVTQFEAARKKTPIVAVQNLYAAGTGGKHPLAKVVHAVIEDPDAVLRACEENNIAFLPFFPLALGGVEKDRTDLAEIAKAHNASISQIAIAWLLAKSRVMLPIPGTSSPEHVEQNWAARTIALTNDELGKISGG